MCWFLESFLMRLDRNRMWTPLLLFKKRVPFTFRFLLKNGAIHAEMSAMSPCLANLTFEGKFLSNALCKIR